MADRRYDLYNLVNTKLKGRLDYQLRSRRERGDTYQDIMFWITTTTKVRVSDEVVRRWCLRALAERVE